MKRKYMLSIVIIGTIGLLIEILNYEFNGTPGSNFDSLGLFKYFTLQSNLIVVVYFFLMYQLRLHETSKLFQHLLAMVTLCITLTFVMFALFLDPIWDPKGFAFVSSMMLHYINPILVIVYFVRYAKEIEFHYTNIFVWIIYPLLYLVFATVYGLITGEYFYPFIDFGSLGIIGFSLSILGMLWGYLLLSFLIVKIVSQKKLTK